MSDEQEQGNWLERKLVALDALYRKFGRDGFRDQPLVDVSLLLSSKEMQFRDTAKGHDLNESQKAANRQLEMEIGDIRSYIKGQTTGLSLADLRSYRQPDWPQQHQQQQFRQRDRGR